MAGRENAIDVLSQKSVQRMTYSDPRTWEQHVSVTPGGTANVKFVISQK